MLISELSNSVPTITNKILINGPLVYVIAEPSPIYTVGYIINVSDPYNQTIMGYGPYANDAEIQDSLIYLLMSYSFIGVGRSIQVPTPQLVFPIDTVINDTLPEFVWSMSGSQSGIKYKIYIYSSDNGYIDPATTFEDTTYIP